MLEGEAAGERQWQGPAQLSWPPAPSLQNKQRKKTKPTPQLSLSAKIPNEKPWTLKTVLEKVRRMLWARGLESLLLS